MNLPQSIDAELAFLGSCLLGAAKEAAELLRPDDFYRTAHGTIFSAIADLVKEGTDVDIVTVANKLRGSGKIEEAGGASFVASLPDQISGSNIETYAEIIKKTAIRRKVIEICHNTVKECHESEDIDSILCGMGLKIAEAESGLNTCDWVRLGDMSQSMIDKWESQKGKGPTGIPTGFRQLDWMIGGLQPANLIVVAARPSMGKSALALKIAQNVAKVGYPVALRSIEMSKEQMFTRSTSDIASVDSDRFRSGDLQGTHWESIIEAVSHIHDLPIFIDDKPVEKIQQLQRSIRQFIKKHRRGLVIIDYLQYIEGIKSDRKDIEIGTVTRGLKATSRELQIPIILLSQLSRNLENRDIKDRRPRKSDLRNSGEIEQDADIIAFIYRDEVYNKNTDAKNIAEIIIDKNRDGKTGIIQLAWIPHRATFENLQK